MQHSVKFQSQNYKKINWVDILLNAYEKNIINNRPTLICRKNFVLIPETYTNNLIELNLATPHQVFCIKVGEIQVVHHSFLESCAIKVGKICSKNYKTPTIANGHPYFQICNQLCKLALECVEDIKTYSLDHLRQREAEGVMLVQHQGIKLVLAQIFCHLESAKKLLSISDNLISMQVVVEHLLNALHKLAKLNGGRAILRGNSIELMFHLNLINAVFITKGRIYENAL